MGIKLGLAGDFCPQGRIKAAIQQNNWQHLFKDMREELLHNDLNVVDLECPLVPAGKARPIAKTGPHLSGMPEATAILNYLNIRLVATANNHFMDFGPAGQEATYQALKLSEIDWVGSGKNKREASRLYCTTIKDVVLAIINVAENEWSTTRGARPGVNPIDPVKAYYQIREARQKADFVVVIAHGGNEHYNLPSPRIKETFRFFVDSGADAVAAHHTHTISGFEIYQGRPIFYGLGNFCFDWPGLSGKPWNTGMFLQLDFAKGSPVKFDYRLFKQNDKEAGIMLLHGSELAEVEGMLESLNQHIADDKKLRSSFDKYCQEVSNIYRAWLEPYSGRFLPGLHRRGLLPSLLTRRKKLLYTNIIRCEAHREVLLKVLTGD